MNSRIPLAVAFAGVLGFASMPIPAQAWSITYYLGWQVDWSGGEYELAVYPGTWSHWYDGIQETMSTMLAGTPAAIDPWLRWDNDYTVALVNYESEFAFIYDDDVLGGAPGITYQRWDGAAWMVEADIFLDARLLWTSSHWKYDLLRYGGSYAAFQTTVMHELGHAMGLNHENRWFNVMGSDQSVLNTNSSWSYQHLGADASWGLIELYGNHVQHDLSVVHWKYLGANGEYSTHQRTQVYSTGGFPHYSTTYQGEPMYWTSRGNTIKVEFTYENAGCCPFYSVPVDFYLSTNDYISIYDTYLGRGYLDLPQGALNTNAEAYIYVPTWLTSGKYYWIGAYIDPTGLVNEENEANNFSYVGLYVL